MERHARRIGAPTRQVHGLKLLQNVCIWAFMHTWITQCPPLMVYLNVGPTHCVGTCEMPTCS